MSNDLINIYNKNLSGVDVLADFDLRTRKVILSLCNSDEGLSVIFDPTTARKAVFSVRYGDLDGSENLELLPVYIRTQTFNAIVDRALAENLKAGPRSQDNGSAARRVAGHKFATLDG